MSLPKFLIFDPAGNPYPAGLGDPITPDPPSMLCYTDVNGVPQPADFTSGGASSAGPIGTYQQSDGAGGFAVSSTVDAVDTDTHTVTQTVISPDAGGSLVVQSFANNDSQDATLTVSATSAAGTSTFQVTAGLDSGNQILGIADNILFIGLGSSTLQLSGIPAPTTTPTGAPSASGAMAAGSYRAWVEARPLTGGGVFFPVSADVVIDGSPQTSIDWVWDIASGITTYRLWISADNGSTWSYFDVTGEAYTQTATAGTPGMPYGNNTTGQVVLSSGNSNSGIAADATGVTIIGLQLINAPYFAAGNPLPTAFAALLGAQAVVSDATLPTYMGVYTSGGTIYAAVICSTLDGGLTYGWYTH